MSHDLLIRNGRAAMAYRGNAPWHQLGQVIPEGASLEEIAELAGFNFEILRQPVSYTDEQGRQRTFDARHILFRSDDGTPLSVMSKDYQIVQPRQVLIDFFDDLCESSGFALETCGILGNGQKYWAMAKTSIAEEICGDAHQCYVLLATSADGSMATTAQPTSVRVVCSNTLQMATYGKNHKAIKVRHSAKFDPKAVKKAMGLVDFEESWEHFADDMRTLGNIEVDDNQARDFFSDLLRPKTERAKPRRQAGAMNLEELLTGDVGTGYSAVQTDKGSPQRAIRGLAELEESYRHAPGAVPGSAYGLLQGVTHFLDHSRGKDAEKRLASSWFGQGANLKKTAYERALAMGK